MVRSRNQFAVVSPLAQRLTRSAEIRVERCWQEKLWEKQLLHSCVSELRSPGHRGVGGHLCPS